MLDHAVNGQYNAAQGAADLQTLANDPNVVGVVGPYNSDVAAAQIPISNAAGLLLCSPANTRIALTQLPDALTYRPTNPDKIAYIRFASVYRQFETPEDFRDALQEVKTPSRKRRR